MFLVITLVPLTLIIHTIDRLKVGKLYPSLSFKANVAIAVVYVLLCVFVVVYMRQEYINLIWLRAGSFNVADKIIGVIVFFFNDGISQKRASYTLLCHFISYVLHRLWMDFPGDIQPPWGFMGKGYDIIYC